VANKGDEGTIHIHLHLSPLETVPAVVKPGNIHRTFGVKRRANEKDGKDKQEEEAYIRLHLLR
jgi:hypothetical protein